jgi:hypothetical protein
MRCERDELAYLGYLLACDGAETEWHFNGEYRITIDYKGRRYDAYSQIDGKVCFVGLSAEQIMDAIKPKTAKRIIVANGATGHCKCSACGGLIGVWDNYCKHCGARLEVER